MLNRRVFLGSIPAVAAGVTFPTVPAMDFSAGAIKKRQNFRGPVFKRKFVTHDGIWLGVTVMRHGGWVGVGIEENAKANQPGEIWQGRFPCLLEQEIPWCRDLGNLHMASCTPEIVTCHTVHMNGVDLSYTQNRGFVVRVLLERARQMQQFPTGSRIVAFCMTWVMNFDSDAIIRR
jgi:hypothetical protein